MNTLLLKPPDGREPFEARVTQDGRWIVGDDVLAWELHVLAQRYADKVGYRLPHVHPAAAAVIKAWPGSELLKPIVHYPQVDERGLPIVY